jgi:hypothetical protein
MWQVSVAIYALAAIALTSGQSTGELKVSSRTSTTDVIGAVTPYFVEAGQRFCEADVTVGAVKDRGTGLWEIVFAIATNGVASSGRFNFRVEIKRANGRFQQLIKSEYWSITRRRGFTVTHRVATQRDETVHNVEVIPSSIRCLAT